MGDISTLLRAWSGGDQSALERLTPIVYDELHRLARRLSSALWSPSLQARSSVLMSPIARHQVVPPSASPMGRIIPQRGPLKLTT